MKFRNLLSAEVYSIIVLTITGLFMNVWGAETTLDTKFFYTVAYAESFFQSLSVSQWQAYLLNEALDLVFLASYSLLFFFLARKFYFTKSWFVFVPGFFDLIETTTIILLLLNRSWSPPIWLGYSTCLKWVTGGIVVISFLFRNQFRSVK